MSVNDRDIDLKTIFLGLAFVTSMVLFGLQEQHQFTNILFCSVAAFVVYAGLLYDRLSFYVLIGIGLLARVALLFLFPGLSDDIYRFVWDGYISASGHNPYTYLPSDIVDNGWNGINQELFDYLNSPEYFTIYPLISQLIYWLSVAFSDTLSGQSMIIKGILLIADIGLVLGLIKLLEAVKLPKENAFWYWLNPLVIIEGMGNVHFEILMVAFLLWSIYYTFVHKRLMLAALLMALAIATKLLPLMFLPYLLLKLGRERWNYFILLGLALLALFLPIISGLQAANFGESIDLYFQKFEFNGSVYYLLREVGQWIYGYNQIHVIGPALGLLTVAFIARKAWKSPVNLKGFLHFAFWSFVVYLLLATTVHPWYLITPLALGVFLGYRFIYLWSFLILLTYINYNRGQYAVNFYIIALEYLLVLSLLWHETKKAAPIDEAASV